MKNELRKALEENSKLPCEYPNCKLPRYKLYRTYVKHFHRTSHHGWHSGRVIPKRELLYEMAQIDQLVKDNPDHPGIKSAVDFLEQWIRDAGEGRKAVGTRHMARLYFAGVSELDLVRTCAVIWLYSWRNPRKLPEGLPLTFALAHRIMRLVPQEYRLSRSGRKYPRRMNNTDKRMIGEHIRNHLALLFHNICRHFEQLEQQEHQFRKTLTKSFHR